MKWCLIHEMFGSLYAYLVLEVGLRDLDKSFHISYLYMEHFWPLREMGWGIEYATFDNKFSIIVQSVYLYIMSALCSISDNFSSSHPKYVKLDEEKSFVFRKQKKE